MVKLITQKIEAPLKVPKTQQLKTESVNKPSDNNQKSLKTTIIPLSMIVGSGILLYLGLTAPSKIKFFNKDVKEKFLKMDEIKKDFIQFVNNAKKDFPAELEKVLTKYKQENTPNITHLIEEINQAKTVTQIFEIQQRALKSLTNTPKAGQGHYDEFYTNIHNLMTPINNSINNKKWETGLILDDLTHPLTFKDGKHQEVFTQAEGKLKEKKEEIIKELTSNNHILNKKDYYNKIMETYTEVEHSKNVAKAEIIKHVNARLEQLGQKTDNIGNLEEIFKDEYLFIQSKTFDKNKTSEKNLRQIFYSTPVNSSLEDFRLLIERVKQYKTYTTKAINEDTIKNMEELLDSLKDFSTKELSNIKIKYPNPESNDFQNSYILKLMRIIGF